MTVSEIENYVLRES